MVETRTIAVMGAASRQGRGVVDALTFTKGDIRYIVRPLTRSASSKLAQRFQNDYPELQLMEWDANDTTSLQRCFEGCYGAFIDSGTPTKVDASLHECTKAELEVGKRIRTAAERAGVKHIVYPTFPSIFNATNGRINIRYYETKHQIAKQLRASSIPSTILCPGPFYTDMDDMHYAFWDCDVLVISTPAQPTKRMGWADPGHDIGWFTRAALGLGPSWMKDENVPVCGQSISYEELASKFSAVTGLKAEYRQCGVDEFGTLPGKESIRIKDVREVGEWLKIAPEEKTCYGTIEMDTLNRVEAETGIKALSWEMFLERTGWRGPPKEE